MNDVVPTNEELIARLRGWNDDYVLRSEKRVKLTGEIFTPTQLVREMLDKLPSDCFDDMDKTFLDPSCGNGQFLSEVLIIKLNRGYSFERSLRSIYGIDIMLDNVEVCRNRLLCGVERFRYIVEHNIICADALTFDFDSWQPAGVK